MPQAPFRLPFVFLLVVLTHLGVSAQLEQLSTVDSLAKAGARDEALKLIDNLLENSQNADDSDTFWRLVNEKSELFLTLNEPELAIAFIDGHLNSCLETEGRGLEYASLLRHKAQALNWQGEWDIVFDLLTEAASIVQAVAPEEFELMRIYEDGGRKAYLAGDYGEAIKWHGLRLKWVNTYPDHEELNGLNLGKVYYNVASSYWGLDERDSVKHYYAKAIDIWTESEGPDFRYLRYIYDVLGSYAWEDGDKEAALEYFNAAGRIQLKYDKADDKADQYQEQGEKLLEEGSAEDALDYYERALNFREETLGENNPSTVGCYNYIARALYQMHDQTKGLSTCQEAIQKYCPDFVSSSVFDNPSDLKRVTSYHFLLDIMILKFKLMKEYDGPESDEARESAREVSLLCIEIIDELRTGRKSEHSQLYWTQKVLPFFEEVIGYCTDNQSTDSSFTDLAFLVMEKSKAFELTQANKQLEALEIGGIPAESLAREREFKEQLTDLRMYIFTEEKMCELADVNKLDIWKDQLDSLENEYSIFVHALEKDYPNYFELKYDAEVASLTDTQSALRESECLLEYFLGDEKLYCMLVTDSAANIISSEDAGDIKLRLEAYRNGLMDWEGGLNDPAQTYARFCNSSAELFETLIPPGTVVHRKLIIIPDGALHYIPLGTLISEAPEDSGRDYAQLPYLIRDHELCYSPSSTHWLASQSRLAKGKGYSGFAPTYEGVELQGNLKPLSFNVEEVTAVQELTSGSAFVSEDCVESAFAQSAKSAGIIHMAMHTILNDQDPIYSGFLFDHAEDSTYDGFLTTGEIYNLDLSSQLVVLSSCNTGDGELVRGEGVMSLARGFSYSGCPSIMMSLWECDDLSTRDIVTSFFKEIKNGKTKSEALRTAQLQYLDGAIGHSAHPYYWSGMALIGNDDAIDISEPSSMIWYILAGLFLVVVAARIGYKSSKIS